MHSKGLNSKGSNGVKLNEAKMNSESSRDGDKSVNLLVVKNKAENFFKWLRHEQENSQSSSVKQHNLNFLFEVTFQM